MMGQGNFLGIFGAAPVDEQADATVIANVARDACRAGYAVVIDRPGGKAPMCTLNVREAKAADTAAREAGRRRHDCGLKHAMTDGDQAHKVIKRLAARVGPVNLGLELGASRMVVVDVDTAAEHMAFLESWAQASDDPVPSMTVSSPGAVTVDGRMIHKDGGHYWFTLPVGVELPEGSGVLKDESGWVAMWARHQVLVPPSRRPEGAYRILSGPTECPGWLIDRIMMEVEARRARAEGRLGRIYDSADPLERWSAKHSWAELLADDGWTETGLVDTCSCPIWTAPGEHASPKSATAHDLGCTVYDVSTGWGPLHVWTDNPPAWLTGRKTWTKVNYISARDYAGDAEAALVALGVNQARQPERAPAEIEEVTADPFEPAGEPPAEEKTSAAGPRKSAGAGKRTLVFVSADKIPMKATRWLWEETGDSPAHWVPVGGLTLLGGREGIGKSTIGYEVAARITRGELPGAFLGQPRPVIVSATEDSWEATIVPRLVAAGADLAGVWRVDVRHIEGHMGPVSLPEDMDSLEKLAGHVGAVALLLDPLMTVVSRKLDSHKDAEVRQALEPLARLLADAHLAGIGLIHVNKSRGSDLLSRLMGSRAFTAVARAALFCAEDKDVPESGMAQAEPAPGPRYIFGQTKNNLAARPTFTRSYTITGDRVGFDEVLRLPIFSSRIAWGADRHQEIGDIVSDQEKKQDRPERPGSVVDQVIEKIRKYLAEHGETPSAEVKDKVLSRFTHDAIGRAVKAMKAEGDLYVWNISGSFPRATMWSLSPQQLSDDSDN